MTVTITELVQTLDELLQPARFRDYCPNGLQVEGRGEVRKLATGVTACQDLLEAAIDWGADAILVHHGYFWKGENPCVMGMKRRRLGALLQADVSLLAYHLPLDAHPTLGNNACLAQRLGVSAEAALYPDDPSAVGDVGDLPDTLSIADLLARIADFTGREPLHIGASQAQVKRLAWCTGAAQGFIDQAALRGAEVYITGEASEQTVHSAREQGIHFIAAGHHATERYGVQAVGAHVSAALGIEHRYFDIDNPV